MSWREAMDYLGMDGPGSRGVGRPVTRPAKPIGSTPGAGFGAAPDIDLARGGGFGPNRGIGAPVTTGFTPNVEGIGSPRESGFNPGMVDQWGRGWASRAGALGSEAVNANLNEARAKLGLPPIGDTTADASDPWNDPNFRMMAEAEGLTRPVSNPSTPSAGESTAPAAGGGAWAVQDQWDQGYAAASTITGVPANFIKAIQRVETGGEDKTGEENCHVPDHPNDCLALNSGVFRTTAESWGLDYERIKKDPNYAVIAIGTTLQNIATSDAGSWGGTPGKTVLEEGGWDLVARVYHGGPNAFKPGWADSNGVTSDEYAGHVANYVNQLDAKATTPGGTNGQSISSPNSPASGQVGTYTGKAIADLADDYALSGIPYDWGGVPRQGQDPRNYTSEFDGSQKQGWDCSGFVSFIFDNLGYAERDVQGGLPDGSHYQAEWAINNGRYNDGMDLSQMQPGDLIFFDTGDRNGAGATTVSPTAQGAAHVGIYLGDGKMINAMQPCGDGDVMGQTCGTGVVALNDGYWDKIVIGWADTSDIVGGAAKDVAADRQPASSGNVR